jgi:hexosaminidase
MLKAAYFEYEQQMGNLLVQQFYINKATGKDITLLTEPHKNYNTGGALTLIDGIRGRIPWYGKEWLGFLGKDMEAIIDLGVIQYISTVNVGVLNATYSWIHLPKSIEVYISGDGENYTLIKKAGTDEIVKQGRQIEINLGDYKTRYVKVKVTNAGKIPQGFPGASNDAWLFVDEIGIE